MTTMPIYGSTHICRVVLPGGEKMPFRCIINSIVVLFFFVGVLHLVMVRNLSFSGTLFFLFSLKNHMWVFFIVDILTLVLILLIFYFCSWLFCKSFIYFKFYHSISDCHVLLFFLIWSLFFLFFLGFFL